jgi:hypothetical protein
MNPLLRYEKTIALLLISIFFALGLYAARHDSVTVDEFMIVPSGIARLEHFGDANWVNAFNPPIVQMALALPVWVRGATVPDLPEGEPLRYRWRLGTDFQEQHRDAYLSYFFTARIVSLLFGLLTAGVVFFWSRELFGPAGGLLSLGLACFCPNLLAHAHLATVDIGFTALVLLCSYLFWRWMKSEWQLWPGFFFALVFSAALLAKFTAVFFVPVYAALAAVPLKHKDATCPVRSRIPAIVKTALMVAGLGLLMINAFYAFEGTGQPLRSIDFRSRTFQAVGDFAPWVPSPLPRWYLKGMDAEKARVEERRNVFFYRGEVTRNSHPLYFLHAISLKTPLSSLLLLLSGAGCIWRVARRDAAHILLPPIVLLFLFSLVIGSNLGLRYVLPVYPFLMVGAGGLGRWGAQNRPGGTVIALLLTATMFSTVFAAPHFLSYFNGLAGGPKRASSIFSDSNLDWGQGLNDLRRTMEKEGIKEVTLSYFGLVDPEIYGISTRPLAELNEGDFVAISVHHLNGITPFNRVPRAFIEHFRSRTPLAWAGDSIVLYQY